jgi:hypothetical protein
MSSVSHSSRRKGDQSANHTKPKPNNNVTPNRHRQDDDNFPKYVVGEWLNGRKPLVQAL